MNTFAVRLWKGINNLFMKKERLTHLDMAKGIGAILVLLGHLQGDEFFSFSPYVLPMCEWIFSFHMPLFFIIAGMLLFHRNDVDKDLTELTKKRFKGIMTPYLWFSLFYMSVVFYAFFTGSVLKETVFVNLWYVFSTYGMNVLWFLPALFFGELLFIFILKKVNKTSVRTIIIISLGAIALFIAYLMSNMSFETEAMKRVHELLITILRPLVVATFVGIGYACQSIIEKQFSNKSERFAFLNNRVVLAVAGIILMAVGLMLVKQNHGVDFRSMVYKNILFYYLCATLNSFGLMLLCKGLGNIKLISFFGVNSLIFMGVHNSKTVLYYGMKLAMYVNQFLTHARGYICYSIIVLFILIYVSIMILLINNFVPFILGKPVSKSLIYKKIKNK